MSGARENFFERDFIGKNLKASFEDALRFCKCVCNLLQTPTKTVLVVEDVTWYLNYRGSDSFSKAVKSLLTLPEPEGENHTQLKHKSRVYLRECVADVMKTAATEEGGNTLLNTLMANVAKILPEPTPGCCAPLQEAMSKLGQVERSVRKGSADPLKSVCLKTAHSITDEAGHQSPHVVILVGDDDVVPVLLGHMVHSCVLGF